MAKTLHKVQEYRFGDRVVFRKTSETTDSPAHFDDNEGEEFPFCVHGHAIRKPEEYGGRCICGRDLCRDCAQNRCDLDGHILCRRCTRTIKDRGICRTHGFWRMLACELNIR